MMFGLTMLLLTSAMPGNARQITDAEIKAYSLRPYDKAQKMGKQEILGVNRGMAVLAEYPCSDLCPGYTTRIIHYDVLPGPACEKAGGVTQDRWVPISIAVGRKAFCVPVVLDEKNKK